MATSIKLADLRQIADVFDPNKAGGYKKGNRVVYHGLLYRFTTAHTGAWNASHVTQVKVGDEIVTFSDPQNDGNIKVLLGNE